ncbi:uncharacterized protein LOC119553416 [Drosophila subpulchrella]|uniref:uncharacterized protein LOC119553416 n=1 Tax=Drosophila subpulchrella TaxID=1486046 RepID=UPI0018A12EBD|nr:uncharacterized protein LOC119553416 [Drosophila subpulchrella]
MLKLIFTAAITMTLLENIQAQRPSFAGLRPPGGLSQKDKYHATQNTAVENITGVDIATRFGESSSSQRPALIDLPYGAPQRPPVGVPVVLPISNSAPEQVPAVANRFGAPDSQNATTTSPTASTAAPVAPVLNQLPVDAHGDREWVNYLSTLPVENQPFWFINYQAIEAHRNSSRPNVGALETPGSFFRG